MCFYLICDWLETELGSETEIINKENLLKSKS